MKQGRFIEPGMESIMDIDLSMSEQLRTVTLIVCLSFIIMMSFLCVLLVCLIELYQKIRKTEALQKLNLSTLQQK